MLTAIFWLIFILFILVVIVWLLSIFTAILKPTEPNTQETKLSQEDEDLEFITKMITFDFFFFDW
ncbi:MAG: hypothetical protein ACE5NG_18510 [bacterium]